MRHFIRVWFSLFDKKYLDISLFELLHGSDNAVVVLLSTQNEIQSPITTISDTSYNIGSMILAKTGDFAHLDLPDKLLAYANMSPFTYQPARLRTII